MTKPLPRDHARDNGYFVHDHSQRGASVLVLGGTGEGRELAGQLAALGRPVISSLAGRVSAPLLPAGEVRIGGFGGVDGLTEYLRAQQFSAVVDATHPFAARITQNAATACAATGTPLLVLRRPPWTPVDGDHWTTVPDLRAAASMVSLLPADNVVLLTIGRQGVDAFAAAPQRFWLRAVDPPDAPVPAGCDLIIDRGPFTQDGELELLQRLAVDLLVTKNSGGPMTVAKLTAARILGLPVLMIERPALPGGVRVVDDVPTALAWTTRAGS
jgi:precorrin-6A/cobalt-precorrin-6A reductase